MVNVASGEFKAYKSEQEAIITDLRNLIEKLRSDNDRLNERVNELENSKIPPSIQNDTWASKLKKTPHQMEIINIMANETKERDKRENNLVIFGLKESALSDKSQAIAEDKQNIELIIQKLNVKVNIKNVIKLKSNNGYKAPYVVILNDKSERNSVLKKAKELKKDKTYENVFINPDLTESERYKSKLLREECKKRNNDNIEKDDYYFGIRNDKVIRIKK